MTQHLTKDSQPLTIRRPIISDAAAIIDYSKIMFASTDQTLTTLEEYTITVEQEILWIKSANENPNALVLIAELDDQIVGLLTFFAFTRKKIAHSGEFGISVHPDFHRLGIARILIESLLTWAKQHPVIEKVILKVMTTNLHAIRLYKDLGFVEEGHHVKAQKQANGEYVDELQMYIETF